MHAQLRIRYVDVSHTEIPEHHDQEFTDEEGVGREGGVDEQEVDPDGFAIWATNFGCTSCFSSA